MTSIAAISFTKLITGLAAAAMESGLLAISTATWSSILSFGAAAIIAVGAIAAVAAAMKSGAQDATEVGDMSYADGETLISTKEGGLFKPSPNDEIAVAPGISDMINSRQQQSSATVVQDNSGLMGLFETLITETRTTNSSLTQLNSKQATIKLDSQNFGTAQIIGNYNLA
jgi:hypothetical protein